jgi:hypothetical protein
MSVLEVDCQVAAAFTISGGSRGPAGEKLCPAHENVASCVVTVINEVAFEPEAKKSIGGSLKRVSGVVKNTELFADEFVDNVPDCMRTE